MELEHSINRLVYSMAVNDIRMCSHYCAGELSYNSVMYLDLIACQKDCTVSSLAEILRVSKPAVTQKVNELIRLGLVVKRQSERDRRVFYLDVIEEVAQFNAVCDRPFMHAVHALEEKYDSDQLALLCEALDLFSAVVTQKAGV